MAKPMSLTVSDPDKVLALARAEIAADRMKAEAAREARRLEIEAEIRVALANAAEDAAHANMPVTKQAKADFIRLLSHGMPVTDICRHLKVASRTLYDHRRTDKAFAQQWEEAIERRYLPIEDRLATIAATGAPDAMATVRAAEVLLKGGIRRYSPQPRDREAVTAAFTDGAGRSVSVTLGGAPLAD